jgi:hypothetical protein
LRWRKVGCQSLATKLPKADRGFLVVVNPQPPEQLAGVRGEFLPTSAGIEMTGS